ncbi:MAG TPA: response regulator [Chondromyces sp.]|nr:response regulator [Chondromyces sp.]
MIKVAIAEDDFRVAQIHEKFLAQLNGVEVTGKALNAKETIQLLEKKEVDLLLLDIYLPDLLGTELLAEIRNRFPKIDIIMVTAATEKDLLETAVRYGVFHYLIKPVSLEKFTQTIEQYQKKKEAFSASKEVNQQFIDSYLDRTKTEGPQLKNLPSGVDAITLQKIKEALNRFNKGVNSEEMGEMAGVSRTTARRYLEYLVSVGEAKAELEYGIVGRPERKYYRL